jgi:hypothetical protein
MFNLGIYAYDHQVHHIHPEANSTLAQIKNQLEKNATIDLKLHS